MRGWVDRKQNTGKGEGNHMEKSHHLGPRRPTLRVDFIRFWGLRRSLLFILPWLSSPLRLPTTSVQPKKYATWFKENHAIGGSLEEVDFRKEGRERQYATRSWGSVAAAVEKIGGAGSTGDQVWVTVWLRVTVFVFYICHNNTSQVRWFKPQKFISSQSWGQDIWNWGVGRVGFFLLFALQVTVSSLFLHVVFPLRLSVSWSPLFIRSPVMLN